VSTDDMGALPASQTPHEDPILSAGLEIARKWGEVLDPEQLQIALKALEPQLKREHLERMKRLEMQEARAEREAREKRELRNHKRFMASLIVGAVMAVATLGAGVYVAQDAWWLGTLLCGPSLLALAKVFVLRRSDPDDMKFTAKTARVSTDAAAQAQPPPVV
jgi:hypothetical protein